MSFNPNIPLNTTFLRLKDYFIQIQQDDLLQLLNTTEDSFFLSGGTWYEISLGLNQNSLYKLFEAEQIATAEVKSYLNDRYLMENVFSSTTIFSSGTTYYSNSLIEYCLPCFNSGTTYNFGDRFSYKHGGFDDIYQAIISTGSTGVYPTSQNTNPNSTAYTYALITQNSSLYFANQPVVSYSPDISYVTGNIVFYNNQFYIAQGNIRGITPGQSLNIELTYGLPGVGNGGSGFQQPAIIMNSIGQFQNIPGQSPSAWALYTGAIPSFPFTASTSANSTYYFSGISPDNTTIWTKGDNRNPQIKNYVLNLALFYLHQAINPRNIPELRQTNYTLALNWFKLVYQGKIDANLPERLSITGRPTVWGADVKHNNFY